MSYYNLIHGFQKSKPQGNEAKTWLVIAVVAFVALCLLFANNASLLWYITNPIVEAIK